MSNDWLTCPVCGQRGKIVEGGYISMLGFGTRVERKDAAGIPFGQVGTEWYGWEIESDRVEMPCGGYKIYVGENGNVITEHLVES